MNSGMNFRRFQRPSWGPEDPEQSGMSDTASGSSDIICGPANCWSAIDEQRGLVFVCGNGGRPTRQGPMSDAARDLIYSSKAASQSCFFFFFSNSSLPPGGDRGSSDGKLASGFFGTQTVSDLCVTIGRSRGLWLADPRCTGFGMPRAHPPVMPPGIRFNGQGHQCPTPHLASTVGPPEHWMWVCLAIHMRILGEFVDGDSVNQTSPGNHNAIEAFAG